MISYASSIDDESASSQKKPIGHVLLIMQGQRSFDHYFGTYPRADGLSNDTKIPLDAIDPDNPRYVYPFYLEQISPFVPKSSSKTYSLSYNDGLMDGFAYAQALEGNDGREVMGYYDSRNIPYYWDLASKYVLADRFFSPTMKTGLPNYLTLYAGQNATFGTNEIPEQGLEIYTIFDRLEERNIPWKVYVQNYESSINYTNEKARSDVKLRYNPLLAIPRFVHNETLNSHIVDLDQYFRDLEGNHTLPNVAFITAPDTNERSPRSPAVGQEFVVSLVTALMKSKYWKDSTFIVTYDEAGGWYDHVAPPRRGDFQLGFRVPTLVVSPYAKSGYVDNTTYDVTSVHKFIEYLFGLSPSSSSIDNFANNMLNAFDFAKPPREPIIPTGTYHTEFRLESGSQKISVEGVQIIYAAVMASILVVVIIWIFVRKRKINIYSIKG
jgi:phospholipase C